MAQTVRAAHGVNGRTRYAGAGSVFPNLVLARSAKARKQEKRLQRETFEHPRARTRWSLLLGSECACGAQIPAPIAELLRFSLKGAGDGRAMIDPVASAAPVCVSYNCCIYNRSPCRSFRHLKEYTFKHAFTRQVARTASSFFPLRPHRIQASLKSLLGPWRVQALYSHRGMMSGGMPKASFPSQPRPS